MKKIKILKDIPVKGKILSIMEDTVSGGNLFFPRLNLRNTLIIENETLGIQQPISFVRPGQPGDILSALINDFKENKDIRIKGKVSYFLIHPLTEMMTIIPFQKPKLPKDLQPIADAVAHLTDTENWEQISEDDKKALSTFIFSGISLFSETNDLGVSVDGKGKYVIRVVERREKADIYMWQSKK